MITKLYPPPKNFVKWFGSYFKTFWKFCKLFIFWDFIWFYFISREFYIENLINFKKLWTIDGVIFTLYPNYSSFNAQKYVTKIKNWKRACLFNLRDFTQAKTFNCHIKQIFPTKKDRQKYVNSSTFHLSISIFNLPYLKRTICCLRRYERLHKACYILQIRHQ